METKRGESKDATCKVMLTINLHNIEQKSLLQKISLLYRKYIRCYKD